MKLKSFCTAKETTDKTRSQTREWDKIFTNNKTEKVLISKISKQLIKDNRKNKQTNKQKKTTNSIKKWAKT